MASKKIYRKVEPRIWHDETFVTLTVEERLVWFYILTHPYGNAVGLYRFDTALAASDTGVDHETVEGALGKFESEKMIGRDTDNKLILIRNWIRSNGPTSPNAASGMLKALDSLPRSTLVTEFLQSILNGLKDESPLYNSFASHEAAIDATLNHISANPSSALGHSGDRNRKQ